MNWNPDNTAKLRAAIEQGGGEWTGDRQQGQVQRFPATDKYPRGSSPVLSQGEIVRWLWEHGWTLCSSGYRRILAANPKGCPPGVCRYLILSEVKDKWLMCMEYRGWKGERQHFVDRNHVQENVPMVWDITSIEELEMAAAFGPESIPIDTKLLPPVVLESHDSKPPEAA